MITLRKISLIRAVLVAAALSTAVMAPAAFAATAEVTIMNTRGADGIYRPALRVLRGGTVIFFNSGEGGLTEDIIRDSGALNAWLAANVPAGDSAEPVSFVVTKIESRPPEKTNVKDCLALLTDEEGSCTREESISYCSSNFPDWSIKDVERLPQTPTDYCYLDRT